MIQTFTFKHFNFHFNNSKSPVLSLQSSRCRRHKFSTTMTVRAPQYPQAVRYNNIHNIYNTYNFHKQWGTISTIFAVSTTFDTSNDICNIKICSISTISSILPTSTTSKASRFLQQNYFIGKVQHLNRRLIGSWMQWCAKTQSTSPPSLPGWPNMSQTRISPDLLELPTRNLQVCKHAMS